MKKRVAFASALFLILGGRAVQANTVFTNANRLLQDVKGFLDVAIGIACIVALGFGVWNLFMSNGDERKVDKGQKQCFIAVLGWALYFGLPLIQSTIMPYLQ